MGGTVTVTKGRAAQLAKVPAQSTVATVTGVKPYADPTVSITWGSILGKPDFGTASLRDAPASGNAAAAQVVLGSDTRLPTQLPVPITQGGTNGVTAIQARQNLFVPEEAPSDGSSYARRDNAWALLPPGLFTLPLAVNLGGTGATNATDARTNLGATTVGNGLFTAANALVARNLLGSTTVGDAVFTAIDQTDAQVQLGGSVSGRAVFIGTAAQGRTALGSGAIGDGLFLTATALAARNLLGVTAVGNSLFTAANAAAARTTIGAGTSNLALGTTSTTAKAGNYAPPIASQAQAETGTNNTEYMTPLRTAEAIAALAGGAVAPLPILGAAASTLLPCSSGGHIANLVVQITANDASSSDFGAATNGTTTVLRPNALPGSTACFTSTDMRTWTQRAIHTAGNWRQYAWDGSNFLAFGVGSTVVSRSPTGTTWAAAPGALPAAPSNTVGQGKATGLPSTPGTALVISQAAASTAYLTTDSGGSWSTVTLPASLASPCLYKAGGLFILVNGSASPTYYTSPTGATGSWTTRTAPFEIRQIIVGASNDRMTAVGSTDGNLVHTCDDAVNWVATAFTRVRRAFGTNLSPPLLLGDVPVYPTTVNGNQVFTVHGGRWMARENTIGVSDITPSSPMLVQGTVTAWSSGNLGSLTLADLTAFDVAQGSFID